MAFVGMWMIPLVMPLGIVMMVVGKIAGIFGIDLSEIISNVTNNLSSLINQWFETPGNAEMIDKIYTELAELIQSIQQMF